MYKILNSRGLGVAGKQNELIELALTHGFSGVEVDMVDLIGRHDTLGKQFACQFLQSAKIDMGTFRLPIDCGASDEQYAADCAKLDTILDLATTLNAKGCYIEISGNNPEFSFQECFEKHQTRLQELSEKFQPSGIKIGLALRASLIKPEDTEGNFKFIQTADELLTLVRAVGQPNVGLCLDAWEWVIAGGTLDQLASAGIGSVITELRLADLSEGADVKAIQSSDRTQLPGDSADSFSVKLCKAMVDAGATEIPISIATDLSTFSSAPRNTIVGQLSKQLDLLGAGQSPFEVLKAEAEAAASEEGAEDESASDDASKVAVAAD